MSDPTQTMTADEAFLADLLTKAKADEWDAQMHSIRFNQYGPASEAKKADAKLAAARAVVDELTKLAPKPAPPPVPSLLAPVNSHLTVVDKTGEMQATINNLLLALRSSNLFEIQIRFDTFLDAIVIYQHGKWRRFTDVDYITLRSGLEHRGFKPIGSDLMRDAVLKIAEEKKFDSAIDWLQSLKWDGAPRVEAFLQKYFGVAPSPYVTACSRYLWTALAGRTLVPGVQADMAPVLIGGQGLRKTKGIQAMVRGPEFYCEIDLSDDDDDSVRKMRGKQVAEIAELKGLKTREAGYIKAFISKTRDEWTPKYREYSTHLDRRLIFIGTGNEEEFLSDETGNRRWLPLTAGPTDVEAIARDRDQLWAEGAALFNASGIAWQDAERLAVNEHDEYFADDEWREPISEWLAKPAGWIPHAPGAPVTAGPPRAEAPFTSFEVIQGALRIVDAGRINKGVEMRVAAILKRLGYARGRATIGGVQTRVWTKRASPRMA